MSEHPDPERLRLWFDGRLNEAESQEIDVHLETCSSVCPAVLDTLSAGEAPSRAGQETPTDSPTPRRSDPPAPAAAGVRIRCPHCHNPLHLGDEDSDEALCPGCGSSFRLREARHTDTTAPTKALGRFQLLERVGLGGFGAVWRARDGKLDRIVALKIPHTGMLTEKEELERFQREARAAAQLRHPGIASVHEVTVLNDLPVIVSEFVSGPSLRDVLEVRRPTFRQAAALAAEVAEALDYAHSLGVVHRDVKPANILLVREPAREEEAAATKPNAAGEPAEFGRPLLLDFGLALRDAAEVTMTIDGHILGTPAYMSPEQAAGKSHKADRRSDVYSLGVVLYELLTGELPFRGSRLMMLQQVLHDEPRSPRKMNQKIPRDLETICLKALAKSPQRRYATGREMADDLRRFLKGEPIMARPVGRLERGWRWCRRKPALAVTGATAALAFALVLAALPLMTMFYLEADAARAQLEVEQSKTKAALALATENERVAKWHAKQEKAAKDEAQKRLSQIEKASNLLDSLFTAMNPPIWDGKGQREAQLMSGLEEATARLDSVLNGDPLTTARLQNTLGVTHLGMGKTAKAVQLLQKARLAREQALGRDHADTLQSMHNLAYAYAVAGQLDKALPLYQQTLEKRKAKLGPDHPDTLQTMSLLAMAYHNDGQRDKALPLLQQTLEKRKAKLGPDNADTLLSMHNLAYAYQDAGQFDKALPLLQQTLEKFKANFTPDYPLTLLCMSNLAGAYQAVGEFDKALPLFQQALEKRKANLGPDHLNTIQSMCALAGAYQAVGEFDKALPLFQQALEKFKANLGPDYPLTLLCMSYLAYAYEAVGKFDKALPLYEQTLEKHKAKLGQDHRNTLFVMNDLGLAYLRANRPNKAIPLFNAMLSTKRKQLSADDPRFAGELAIVAMNLLEHKQVVAAEPVLRECLKVRAKNEPDAWSTFNTKSMLGGSLLGQKKYKDAEPLLKEGYEGMKVREKTIPPQGQPRLTEALERLVELHDRLGQPDQAARWRKELETRTKVTVEGLSRALGLPRAGEKNLRPEKKPMAVPRWDE